MVRPLRGKGGGGRKAGPPRKNNFFWIKKKVSDERQARGLSGRTTSGGTFFAASLTWAVFSDVLWYTRELWGALAQASRREEGNARRYYIITLWHRRLVHFWTASILWKLDKASWTFCSTNDNVSNRGFQWRWPRSGSHPR